MPAEILMRSSGRPRAALTAAGMEAWLMKHGRLIWDVTLPKLTVTLNSLACSTISLLASRLHLQHTRGRRFGYRWHPNRWSYLTHSFRTRVTCNAWADVCLLATATMDHLEQHKMLSLTVEHGSAARSVQQAVC